MLKLKFNIIINNIGKALQAVGTIPILSFQFQYSHELEELHIDKTIKQWHERTSIHPG